MDYNEIRAEIEVARTVKALKMAMLKILDGLEMEIDRVR